jgi:hypothetical protein
MSNEQNGTADPILNNALKNQKDAKLYENENAVMVGLNQNNAAYQGRLAENETIQNQVDTGVANE